MRYRHIVLTVLGSLLLAGPVSATEEVTYKAVFLSGKKIGHVKLSREVSGDKVTTTEQLSLVLQRQGMSMTIDTAQTALETTAGEPLGFESVQKMAGMATTTKAVVSNGQIEAEVSVAGNVRKQTMPWPSGALLSEGMQLLARKKGLVKDTTYECVMFEPSLMTAMPCNVRVGGTKQVDLLGRVVRLTEVEMTVRGPTGQVRMTGYVDENCDAQKVVTSIMGMNMEMVACSRAFALSPNEATDFFDKVLVSSPVSLAKAASAGSITYHLQPVGTEKLEIPTTDVQAIRTTGGKMLVTVRKFRPPAGAKLPYRGKDKAALEALKPSRFVESDNQEIVAMARRAVGGATDAATAARNIERFVRSHIRTKNLSVGYASAVEVAKSRQGDCTEHAVLTAALCRAAGIPTRVVAGIAYAGQFGNRSNVFVPHAWVEVFVGGKWTGLDAAMPGWDARRIALTVGNGDMEDFFGMVNTLGYFRIQKVSIAK